MEQMLPTAHACIMGEQEVDSCSPWIGINVLAASADRTCGRLGGRMNAPGAQVYYQYGSTR